MKNRVEAIELILERSPYLEYLCKYIKSLGFMFPNGCEVVLLAGKEQSPLVSALGLESPSFGVVEVKSIDPSSDATPELWIEVDEEELISLAEQKVAVSKMSVSNGEGRTIHPQVETLVKRIFMSLVDNGFPLSDRIELIYGAIFGFVEPRVTWKSEKSEIFVLKYEGVHGGLDAYITSGFTNPELESSDIEFDNGSASGYGYELMMLAQPNDTVLVREFISWTKFVEETGHHIYPGQYLEYQEGRIPGTDLGGFIVVPPIDLPEIIPVASGYGRLNLFIGVTPKELDIAKREDDIYIVADQLFENGYINYSPLWRDSVV